MHGDEVVGIFRAVEAQAVVAQATQAEHGKVRVGLSTGCRGIAEVARGYWEAVRALRYTSDAEPCIDLRQVGPLRYLEFSADSVARRLAIQCAGGLVASHTSNTSALADTVLSYAECGFNARLTAERLGVHLNTVHNRLERVAEVLGRPEMRPIDFVELATAIRICRTSSVEQTG